MTAWRHTYERYNEEPPLPKEALPTMYDLPDEEVGQPGMPDIFHVWQGRLLDETFQPPAYEPEEFFTAVDLNVYYNVHDTSQNKRPDWFAAIGLPKDKYPGMRLSYVIWQEEVTPLIVVELLSPSTEKEDLGKTLRPVGATPSKWEVYQRWLRVPYYVTFSRYTDEMRVFKLSRSLRYREVRNHQGRLWLEEAKLGLGLWQGRYLNRERLWLRWYDRAGNWIPTPHEQRDQAQEQAAQAEQHAKQTEQYAEQAQQRLEQAEQYVEQAEQRVEQAEQHAEQERQRAEQERQRAEQERQRAEQERQRAEQLAAKLRALGIDPDQV